MKITYADIASNGNIVTLTVGAVANTLGWKNVGLSRVAYFVPPADGVQEFVLHGTPPTGITLPALQLFKLEERFEPADWFRGVRIIDSSGGQKLTLYKLMKGAEPIGDDPVFLSAAGLNGDKLQLEVRYGGGCAPHHFQLAWDGAVIKTLPPKVILTLSHDGHGDSCRAFVSNMLQFDLSDELPNPEQYVIIVSSGATEVIAHDPGLQAA